MNKKFILLSLFTSTLALSACAGGGAQPTTSATGAEQSSMNPELKTSAIDKAMERALADAEKNGNQQEILAMLQQVYNRNPKDPIVTTRYARALREDDQVAAAARTLQPFVQGEAANVEAITEMAMVQLAQGEYHAAKSHAVTAIDMNPKNARAYLARGTAEDALGEHQNAEMSFRQGLKYWSGDPSPILNNLALNLASQGHLEQSLALLEKAKKISPHRTELERNRRIISTLLETTGPQPPAPNAKPDVVIPDSAKPAPDGANDVVKPQAKPAPKAVGKPTPSKKPSAKSAEKLSAPPQESVKKEEKAEEQKPMTVISVRPKKTKTNIKLKPLPEE